MDEFSVPSEVKEEIERVLKSLRSPKKLAGAKWLLSSCLVEKYLRHKPAPPKIEALRGVLDDALDLLAKNEPGYADVLRFRFWEDHTVKELLNKDVQTRYPKGLRAFYDYQKAAVELFTTLLWQMEQACRRGLVAEVGHLVGSEGQAPIDHQPESNEFGPLERSPELAEASTKFNTASTVAPNSARSKRRTFAIGLITIVVAIALLAALGTLSSRPSLTISPAPSIPSSLCGETSRVIAPDSNRFLRTQGVSAFTKENTNGAVPNNTVRAIAIAPWAVVIGYFDFQGQLPNGLALYDRQVWAICNMPGDLSQKNVNAIAVARDGKIWVAAEHGGVFVLDRGTWHQYTTSDGLPTDQTYGLTIDDKNNIWVATWEGVAKYDGRTWTIPYSINNTTLFNNHVHAIVIDSEGNIWIGFIDKGVIEYRAVDNQWVPFVAKNGSLCGNMIRGIVVRTADASSPESVWFATADGGVCKFEGGRWTTYGIQAGLPTDSTRGIAVDRYGRIWAATSKGVVYLNGTQWITYDTLDTFSIAFGPHCQNCPYDDDHIWTGTVNSGLTHSRIPLLTNAVDIIRIKLVTYPDLTEIPGPDFAVAPGTRFLPEITVRPRTPYDLRQDRGDFLSHIDVNDAERFGAYFLIPVKGTIDPGQPFTFVDNDNPFVAPQLDASEQEKTFTSTWRVWMHDRYVDPPVQIMFTVRKP